MKGRILYIAYQTPPHGGARGIRIANIIRYLSEFGWQLDVVTVVLPPSFAFYDHGLTAKLPSSAGIFRTSPGLFRRFYRDRVETVGDASQSSHDTKPSGL